jgi:hypothetical protein
MESDLQKPALVAAKSTPKVRTIVYWIVTALFCLQMSFTAYAQLSLPQVTEMFSHLGSPRLLPAGTLVGQVPRRGAVACAGAGAAQGVAYAGFAIILASALIAHFSMGDGPEVWSWAAATGVPWGLSYFFWRRHRPRQQAPERGWCRFSRGRFRSTS